MGRRTDGRVERFFRWMDGWMDGSSRERAGERVATEETRVGTSFVCSCRSFVGVANVGEMRARRVMGTTPSRRASSSARAWETVTLETNATATGAVMRGGMDRKRSMSFERAMRAAVWSMESATTRARGGAGWDVACAWALATGGEIGRALGVSSLTARAVTACAVTIGWMHLALGWMRYESHAHAMVDACGALAVTAEAASGGRTDAWTVTRGVIRLALVTRVCAASALWVNLGDAWRSSASSDSESGRRTTGARGVFHRLEHVGAVNVAACVSLAVVALGPATDAHRVLSSSGFLTRVFDEDVLRAVRRVEQTLVAAVTSALFNTLFNATRRQLLGRPLQEIIETLEYHAKQVLTDLDFNSDEMRSLDISVLGYVLDKMSHIVKRNYSDNGSPALIEAILEDREDVDGSTREWLVSYKTNRTHVGKSSSRTSKSRINAFKSVVSSFARASDAVASHPSVNFDHLNSWTFDVFDVDKKDHVSHVTRMFQELDLFQLVDPFKLRRFISEVENSYRGNPYHCFKHALDVAHTTYLYILAVKDEVNMTPIEMFSLLVAALVHDMDHPGLTNAYLIATRDNIALTYNDESVLENHHLSRFFSLCQNNEDADILSAFDEAEYKEVRRTIIKCVLHTDMAHHFKLVSRLDEIVTLWRKNDIINGTPIGSPIGSPIKTTCMNKSNRHGSVAIPASEAFKTDEERQFMLNVLLHCADISNVVKPNELCVKWASRVLEEFFNQGDRERARGLPISPMMDRETTSVGLSQINFIEFIIAPLFVHFTAFFPSMDDQLRRLVDNRRYYQRVYEDELRASTESDGVDRSVERDNLRARFRTLAEKHALHRFLTVSDNDDDDDLIRAIFARERPDSPPRSHAKRRVDF